jgi:competence ComEA-like helix-hairpin-helix protein
MSDGSQQLLEKREAAKQQQAAAGRWMWLLIGIAFAAVLVFVILRGDPSTGPVNPNTADAALLSSLPSVGPDIANKIIAKRAEKPFTKPEDLLEVPGIGPKTLEKMKPRLKFQ